MVLLSFIDALSLSTLQAKSTEPKRAGAASCFVVGLSRSRSLSRLISPCLPPLPPPLSDVRLRFGQKQGWDGAWPVVADALACTNRRREGRTRTTRRSSCSTRRLAWASELPDFEACEAACMRKLDRGRLRRGDVRGSAHCMPATRAACVPSGGLGRRQTRAACYPCCRPLPC